MDADGKSPMEPEITAPSSDKISPNKFVVTIIKKVKTETSKRKVEVEEDLTFGYDEIKYTKYLIRFK